MVRFARILRARPSWARDVIRLPEPDIGHFWPAANKCQYWRGLAETRNICPDFGHDSPGFPRFWRTLGRQWPDVHHIGSTSVKSANLSNNFSCQMCSWIRLCMFCMLVRESPVAWVMAHVVVPCSRLAFIAAHVVALIQLRTLMPFLWWHTRGLRCCRRGPAHAPAQEDRDGPRGVDAALVLRRRLVGGVSKGRLLVRPLLAPRPGAGCPLCTLRSPPLFSCSVSRPAKEDMACTEFAFTQELAT